MVVRSGLVVDGVPPPHLWPLFWSKTCVIMDAPRHEPGNIVPFVAVSFRPALTTSLMAPCRLTWMKRADPTLQHRLTLPGSRVTGLVLAQLVIGVISTMSGWEPGPFFALWGCGWALIWLAAARNYHGRLREGDDAIRRLEPVHAPSGVLHRGDRYREQGGGLLANSLNPDERPAAEERNVARP